MRLEERGLLAANDAMFWRNRILTSPDNNFVARSIADLYGSLANSILEAA
jgi:hypothetical protein